MKLWNSSLSVDVIRVFGFDPDRFRRRDPSNGYILFRVDNVIHFLVRHNQGRVVLKR
jgi:predicted HTH transcriptional regulator